MRTLGMRCLAALLLVAPVAATADNGFEWLGQAGLLYTRNDAWLDNGFRSTQPHLDVDLRLDVGGFFADPGAFRWNGGVAYRRVSDAVNGAPASVASALTYKVGASLFDNRASPLRASVFAARTDLHAEFGQAATPGTTTDQSVGGVFALASPQGQALRLGYQRRTLEEEFPQLSRHDRTDHLVSGSATAVAGPANLTTSYSGQWSSGSWAIDDFEQHLVQVNGSIQTGRDWTVAVGDSYFRRTPTNAAAGNYSADLNSFSAAYRRGSTPGDVISASYRTSHGITESSGSAAESLSHSGQYQQDFRLSEPRYFIRGIGDLSLSEQRSSTAALRATGETGSVQLWYRRQVAGTTVEWNVGPSVGSVQVPDEPARLGYGGGGGLRASAPWREYLAAFAYSVDWRSDLFGVRGWSLSQLLNTSLSGAAGTGRLTGQLVAGATRGWSPVFGDSARRDLQLSAAYALRRFRVDARTILASGTVAAGPGNFSGDGLFVPVGFDSHSLTGGLGASAEVLRNTTLSLSGATTYMSGPGRPTVNYWEAKAGLVFHYGAFDLSAEDRYFTFPDGSGARGNLFLLRASRRFGSRY